MKTLAEIYQDFKAFDGHGDKGTTHTYIPEYERLLKDYRFGSNVLELGLAHGKSLEMWAEYFIDSSVCGVEFFEEKVKHLLDDSRFTVLVGNVCDPALLPRLPHDNFDVIIDDASHVLEQQVASFNLFKNIMNEEGIYIIEDVADLDGTKIIFKSLHDNCEIIDNRHLKNQSDDVLIVYRF